jgi:hypothetical protein
LAPAVLSHAGLHVTALLRAERDEDQVCAAAAAGGIATTGLRRYLHGRPGRPGVVLGFGAIDTGELPADLTAGSAASCRPAVHPGPSIPRSSGVPFHRPPAVDGICTEPAPCTVLSAIYEHDPAATQIRGYLLRSRDGGGSRCAPDLVGGSVPWPGLRGRRACALLGGARLPAQATAGHAGAGPGSGARAGRPWSRLAPSPG